MSDAFKRISGARGHLANVRAHGRAEDIACSVIEHALDSADAAFEALAELVEAFSNPEAGETDRKLAIENARKILAGGTRKLEVPERLVKAMRELIKYADLMPKKTPAAGGCSTEHQFSIEAGAIWGLDERVQAAVQALEEWDNRTAQAEPLPFTDELAGMTQNRDNLREYLQDAKQETAQAHAKIAELTDQIKRMQRMVDAAVAGDAYQAGYEAARSEAIDVVKKWHRDLS